MGAGLRIHTSPEPPRSQESPSPDSSGKNSVGISCLGIGFC